MTKGTKAVAIILCMLCLNLTMPLTAYANASWHNQEIMQTQTGQEGLRLSDNGLYYAKRNPGSMRFQSKNGMQFTGVYEYKNQYLDYLFTVKDEEMVHSAGKENGMLYEENGILRAHDAKLQEAAENFIQAFQEGYGYNEDFYLAASVKEWHAFEDLIKQGISNSLVWAGQENILSAKYENPGCIVLSMRDKETVEKFRSELTATDHMLEDLDQRVSAAVSKKEIITIVNRFVCEKLEYNYEIMKDDMFRERENCDDLAAAVYGTGTVCAGYCNMFKLLCERYGIRTESVESKGGSHAWSVNMIEGQWLYTDVTWNDTIGTDS